MSRPKVLFIAHNHPDLHPGGSEIFAHDLFRAMKDGGMVEALFLACTNKLHREQRPGTVFQTVGRSADEMLLWAGHFDHFNLSQVDLHGMVPELTAFLQEFRPDIVHFHHALLVGVETIFLIRRVLPQARIVFTLHDYYAICANHGQMIKTGTNELCTKASPDSCGKCFPETNGVQFALREGHLRRMYGLVDQFIAPSEFLRHRYVEWGLDPARIKVLRNGRPRREPVPHNDIGRPSTFGYFGNVSPFKGTTVAIEAARQLHAAGRSDVRLKIHGSPLFQTDAFKKDFADSLSRAKECVTHHGPYRSEEIPSLMAGLDWVVMPSIWWENAPLVIQEAFQQKRPVICSGIGGMAEMVENGISGLHFRPGDAASLADAMHRAITEPGLREKLVAGIPEVPTMRDTALEHEGLYRDLLCRPLSAAA